MNKKTKKILIIVLTAVIVVGFAVGGTALYLVNKTFSAVTRSIVNSNGGKIVVDVPVASSDAKNQPEFGVNGVNGLIGGDGINGGSASSGGASAGVTTEKGTTNNSSRQDNNNNNSNDGTQPKTSQGGNAKTKKVVLTSEKINELEKKVSVSDKTAVLSILSSALPSNLYSEVVSATSGNISQDKINEVYGILRSNLTGAQKSKIYQYYVKYISLVE